MQVQVNHDNRVRLAEDTAERVSAADERLVQVNGVRLCVQSFGDPADPAVLLIHGAGHSLLAWDEELIARLTAGGR